MVYNTSVSQYTANAPQANNTPSNVMQGLRQPTQQTQTSLPQSGISGSLSDINQYGAVTDYASILAPKPNNNLVAKAALMGATLAFVGPLAAPMLGNMAKSAFGFVKNILPQLGNVASHLGNSDMVREVVGSTVGNIVSNRISK